MWEQMTKKMTTTGESAENFNARSPCRGSRENRVRYMCYAMLYVQNLPQAYCVSLVSCGLNMIPFASAFLFFEYGVRAGQVKLSQKAGVFLIC